MSQVRIDKIPDWAKRTDIDKFVQKNSDAREIVDVKLKNGFAYVEFADAHDAETAADQLDGEEWDGTSLKVMLVQRRVSEKESMKEKKDENLMSTRTLDVELDWLASGALSDGRTYVYRLWRSLLDRWLHDDYDIYVVTPFIDATRLSDIGRLILRNKAGRGQLRLYVKSPCDGEKTIWDLMDGLKEEKDEFSQQEGSDIQKKLRKSIHEPKQKFQGKFIAGVSDKTARVLMTSANFNENHFSTTTNETVVYIKMDKKEFYRKYLDPLTE